MKILKNITRHIRRAKNRLKRKNRVGSFQDGGVYTTAQRLIDSHWGLRMIEPTAVKAGTKRRLKREKLRAKEVTKILSGAVYTRQQHRQEIRRMGKPSPAVLRRDHHNRGKSHVGSMGLA